jgi:hypothetical protein
MEIQHIVAFLPSVRNAIFVQLRRGRALAACDARAADRHDTRCDCGERGCQAPGLVQRLPD